MGNQNEKKSNFTIRKKTALPLLLLAAAILLNAAGRMSSTFCNFYVKWIFPLWGETYGRITGLFPFSVGEWLLYLAVVILIVFFLFSIVMLLFFKKLPEQIKNSYKAFAGVLLWLTAIVFMIMTLNCFLLYHVSPISERYRIGEGTKTEYGAGEIGLLRDYVVENANALAEVLPRDQNGYLIYEGDMKTQAIRRMQLMGESYENLKGYYPRPKALWASDFFSQQYIMGYYFPFSMEANYNDRMYLVNMPVTMCHELSHLKGFILEDEANFIGYLACVNAEDAFFNYSAYLSVIHYLDRDFYEAVGKNNGAYFSHPMISAQVLEDKKFLTEEEWEKVEETAVIDTEIVKEASDVFLETNLTINGVADGKISYSRVVDLLLRYYDGILY